MAIKLFAFAPPTVYGAGCPQLFIS